MARRPSKYIKRTLDLRAKLWPDLDDKIYWNRKRYNGFVTVPRTMSLVMSIIDDLTKGKPASSTYFELWCRAYDEMYVSLSKSKELAFQSGFIGQRAERTWADRIKMLDELGFISVRSGAAGALSHAVILNPHLVIKRLYAEGRTGIMESKYNALIERGNEIGADDLDIEIPVSEVSVDLEDEIPF